jgi:hypothetical protein
MSTVPPLPLDPAAIEQRAAEFVVHDGMNVRDAKLRAMAELGVVETIDEKAGPPSVPESVRNEPWGKMQRRLEIAGKWSAFNARWQELKAEFKRRKWPRKEARFQAMAEFADAAASPDAGGIGEEASSVQGMEVPDSWTKPPPAQVTRTPDHFSMLALSARGKKATAITNVSWVSNNLEIPPESIEEDGVPSPAAIALLRWAKKYQGDFFDLYSKLIPSRAQVENDLKFDDDGENVTAALRPFAVEGASYRAE